MRNRAFAISCAALVVACSTTDGTPAPAPITLAQGEAWAGSTLRVRSTDFDLPGADTARLLIGDRTLAMTRVDDTTLAVALPSDLGGGDHAVRIARGRDTAAVGPLRVYGYVDRRGFSLVGGVHAQYAPRTAPHLVAAVSTQGGGALRLYDLVAGTVTEHGQVYRQSALCHADEEGVVWMRRAPDAPFTRWRLHPTPVQVAGESFDDSTSLARACFWTRPDTRLVSSGDQINVERRTGPASPWTPLPEAFDWGYDALEGLALSPGRDLALLFGASVPRVAMYETATARRRFPLPAPYSRSYAADFSEGSEFLAASTSLQGAPFMRRLVVVRLADESVVRDTLMGGTVVAIRYDQLRPLLYVVTRVDGVPEPHAEVVVFHTPSLAVLGRLSIPVGTLPTPTTLVAPTTQHLHVFDGAADYRLALPPGSGVFPP